MRLEGQRCLELAFRHGRSRLRGPLTSFQRRHLSSDEGKVKDVAVLGGGITGLATVYQLSKEFPNAEITLYEGSDRLGGWLKSKHVEVDGGTILFEQGPRTLRPSLNGIVTAALIQDLGLVGDVIYTPKTAPAALNRFIYYPDHLVRIPMPGGTTFWGLITSLLTEPLFRETLVGILKEPLVPERPANLEDESLGSFFSRRLGRKSVDNLVSAFVHGVYAGDVYELSVRSLFPRLWKLEAEYSSVIAGALAERNRLLQVPERDAELLQSLQARVHQDRRFATSLGNCSVFSLRGGLGQLVNRLVEELSKQDNVSLKTHQNVLRLERDRSSSVKIALPNKTESKEYVISTLSAQSTFQLCQQEIQKTSYKELRSPISVTVMVVNLYFRNSSLLPVQGFGYLIPRSIPFAQNPEFALGVVFDSDVMSGQDTAKGTKVTVMLGGHWWNGWRSYPDAAEGVAMARTVLARHLRVTEEPAAVHAELQRNCIPQFTVGHTNNMSTAHKALSDTFQGRLRVAGSSYSGVGVHDCLRSARDVVMGLKENPGAGKTGLEYFGNEERWVELGRQSREAE